MDKELSSARLVIYPYPFVLLFRRIYLLDYTFFKNIEIMNFTTLIIGLVIGFIGGAFYAVYSTKNAIERGEFDEVLRK